MCESPMWGGGGGRYDFLIPIRDSCSVFDRVYKLYYLYKRIISFSI